MNLSEQTATKTLYMYGLAQFWTSGDALSKAQSTTNMPTIQTLDRIALSNLHGDITELVKLDNSILNTYSYDAFGNLTDSQETVQNRFKYAGEQQDKVSGFYYLRTRYYNPETGRFTQEDIYRGDGLNLYSYVSANPMRYVDPSGMEKRSVSYWAQYQLKTVSRGSLSAQYQYYLTGNVDTLTYSNGLTAQYTYDRDGKALKVEYRTSGGAILSYDAYTYYSNGNIKSENKNGEIVNYTCDARNRLKSEGNISYTYDNAGNRLTKTEGGQETSYTYNSLNQLITVLENSKTIRYDYDDNGNLISDSEGNTYTYDSFGYNLSVEKADGTSQYNTYNAIGERIAVEENGSLTRFVVDRGQVVAEQLLIASMNLSEQTATKTLYIYGLAQLWTSGDALSKAQPTTNMPTIQTLDRIALSNLHGDITELVKLDNSILNTYTYDAFGNLTDSQETV